MKLDILFEDDDIIVINKPPGILSIGDRFTFNIPSLLAQLRKKYEKILTVHRLDKDTSGCIVFAKTEEAHRVLSMQFEQKKVQKKYYAFVEGYPGEHGVIEEPIAESPYVAGKMVVHKKGKPSLTHYRTLSKFNHISLVDIELFTGRTHQIRVHMKHIGHPLFIDPKYGNRDHLFLSELKGRKYRLSKGKEERPFINRLTLHSYLIGFNHPITEEPMEFKAPLPKDFKALNNQLSKIFGDELNYENAL